VFSWYILVVLISPHHISEPSAPDEYLITGVYIIYGAFIKTLIGVSLMSKMTKQEQEEHAADWYERTHKNWRSWGSWFSWGSPVGLGLFFIACAVTIWIIAQAF